MGVTGLPSDQAVLDSVVRADGGEPAKVRSTTIGFAAVPSLAAGKVDAVVTFWNAEGVALRRRGVRTREFRVDRYGAPRYPELVVATKRATVQSDPELVRAVVSALRAGTRAAASDLPAASAAVARRSQGNRRLTDAQLRAVAPAFAPALELRRPQLEGWAAFDARFGILRRRPDVDRAFALDQDYARDHAGRTRVAALVERADGHAAGAGGQRDVLRERGPARHGVAQVDVGAVRRGHVALGGPAQRRRRPASGTSAGSGCRPGA